MSKNLIKNTNFLKLLLTTSKQQGIQLLKTVTDSQILLLSEIAHNLITLKHIKNIGKIISKRRRLLSKLSKTSRHVRERKAFDFKT